MLKQVDLNEQNFKELDLLDLHNQNKLTEKKREFGFEEMDGTIQALAWFFANGFGVPATKIGF